MTFKVGQIVRVKPLDDRFDFTIEARIEAIVRSDRIYESRIIPSGNNTEFDLFGSDGVHILEIPPGWYFLSERDERFCLSGQMHDPSFAEIRISIEVIE